MLSNKYLKTIHSYFIQNEDKLLNTFRAGLYSLINLTLLLLVLISCSKDVKIDKPIVEIFSPEYRQLFLLPDTIVVNFSITHNTQIEYIRVSIVNKNMIPVSDQVFLYPNSSIFNNKVDIYLNVVTDNFMLKPYYIHIVVSDFTEVHHTYLEIELSNRDKEYKGCFLIGKSGVDMLSINYYNEVFQSEIIKETSGNYSGSDISSAASMLYLITQTPDLARAFNGENGELIWTQNPQLPYPEFNSILVDENIVYFSTAIGRIIGLTIDEGIQVFTTLVLPDSIPMNICSTTDYLVTDTKLRNSNSKIWISYYKQTGYKYQVFPVDYETVDLYGFENENAITVFCNDSSNGKIIRYNVYGNNIEENITIVDNKIQQTCKIDENNFLFSSGKAIFHFNWQNKSYIKVGEMADIIIDIKYDIVNNRLFVIHDSKAQIYTYPGLVNLAEIETAFSLKGAELKYGY